MVGKMLRVALAWTIGRPLRIKIQVFLHEKCLEQQLFLAAQVGTGLEPKSHEGGEPKNKNELFNYINITPIPAVSYE